MMQPCVVGQSFLALQSGDFRSGHRAGSSFAAAVAHTNAARAAVGWRRRRVCTSLCVSCRVVCAPLLSRRTGVKGLWPNAERGTSKQHRTVNAPSRHLRVLTRTDQSTFCPPFLSPLRVWPAPACRAPPSRRIQPLLCFLLTSLCAGKKEPNGLANAPKERTAPNEQTTRTQAMRRVRDATHERRPLGRRGREEARQLAPLCTRPQWRPGLVADGCSAPANMRHANLRGHTQLCKPHCTRYGEHRPRH